MRSSGGIVWPARVEVLALAAIFIAACAYGVEPDRSALEGSGGASSSASSSGSNVGGSNAGSGGASSSSSSSSSASSSSASSSSASSSSASSSSSSAASSGAGGAPPAGLHVQYKAGDTNATNNEIKPQFDIVNGSPVAVPLAQLKVRYYYTLEPNGSQNEAFHCDYAFVDCANVSGTFNATSGMNADHYLEVSFSAATVLQPGQSSGQVQIRYNKSDYATYDETNDYSFDPTKLAFTDWDRATLYENGTLVWGTEP